MEPLKELKHLERLDLEDTPLSELEDYREKVFLILPQLNIVDGYDKEGNELDYTTDEDEEGEIDDSEENEDEEEDDEDEDDSEDDEDDEDEEEEDEDEEEN